MGRLFVLAVGVLVGLTVAQGVDPSTLPKDWTGLIALLLSGTTGLGVFVVALKKGINFDELARSKTTWTALSGLFGAFGLYASGQINLVQLLAAVYLALATIFLRDAVASATKAAIRDEQRGRLMR